MKKLFCCLLALVMAAFLAKVSSAAEHPGAPAKAEHKEHPGTHAEEHPGEKAMLSADEIIKGIKGHISAVTEANNGVYPLTDAEEGKGLKLTLIKVHEDKVSYIKKDDAYFACTDFVAEDGTEYDVDFWMKKNPEGVLQVYQTKIHKKSSIPRFTYQNDEIVDLGPAMAPEEHT